MAETVPWQDAHWATLQGEDLAAAMRQKFKNYEDDLVGCGDMERMRLSTLAYYGEDENGHTTARVAKAGDKDEGRILKVNEYRNVLSNKLTIATADPPDFMPVPTNTDERSQAAQQLAKGLLHYYAEEKQVDQDILEATEAGEALAFAYVDVRWDPNAGEEAAGQNPSARYVVGQNGEPAMDKDGKPLLRPAQREGDVRSDLRLPIDVARDLRKRGKKSDWLIIRRMENKYDLAAALEAQHPGDPAVAEAAASIRGMRNEKVGKESLFFWGATFTEPSLDDVEVLELRHLKTPAVPDGRLVELVGDVFLRDVALPYRDLSCFRYEAGRRFGTPRSYASAHDGLGLQAAVDGLTSLIYTALRISGVPPMYAQEGSGFDPQKARGLTVIFGKRPPAEAPVVLNMPQPSESLGKFWEALRTAMGNLQGMDNLSMGREERDLSGSAMALLDTRTQRAVSRSAKAYLGLRREVYDAILWMIRQFASSTRKVTLLVGKSKSPMLKAFTGQDLEPIDRVVLKTVSPASRSPGMRLEMAKDLIATKGETGAPLIDAQQYVTVVETGELDPATEAPMANRLRIRRENEALAEGRPVLPAVWGDPHHIEIPEHFSVLNSDEARANEAVRNGVFAHILTHLQAWRTADPAILAATGTPPPPPPPMLGPGGPPGAPGAEGGEQPPQGGSRPPPGPGGAAPTGQAANMPSPPTNPATGEEYSPTAAVHAA